MLKCFNHIEKKIDQLLEVIVWKLLNIIFVIYKQWLMPDSESLT